MTTPRTSVGKVAVICYGFLGCSGAILFFNLFLERIITFMAFVLRCYHERAIRKRIGAIGKDECRGSVGSLDEDVDMYDDNWKPSVYWVMAYLFVAATIVACAASALYTHMERWSFIDALYFCFVSFATIGFGDLVSSQEPSYPLTPLYRFANFAFVVLGCCCLYSLFNVISIVIKQFLNFLIRKLDMEIPTCCPAKGQHFHTSALSKAARHAHGRSASERRLRSRRNAITPNHVTASNEGSTSKSADTDMDSNYDSEDDDERQKRMSTEMISMRDVLGTNRVSLAVMQKQLYETAQAQRGLLPPAILLPQRTQAETCAFAPGTVGSLAIVSSKFGDTKGRVASQMV